jgi:hypothetical protein
MKSIGKYLLRESGGDPALTARAFTCRREDNNNIVISWEWPPGRGIRLMLVFEHEEPELPALEDCLRREHPHKVVARDMANRFQTVIQGARKRYRLVPAYFDDSQAVVVCEPAYVTDWFYRSVRVTTSMEYKPLPLGGYRQAVLTVRMSDTEGAEECVARGLRYGVYENNTLLGTYPLDMDIIKSGCMVYLEGGRRIRFSVEPDYAHVLELDAR